MTMNLHIAILVVSTVAIGWLMMTAGLQKSALELRRRRRICPSCGHEIRARVCTTCAG
jgi:formate dehydrogenase maturation protein FdhE